MLVQKSIIRALGGFIVIEEYYRSTGEAVLVQQSNKGALGMLYRYRRVLLEHSKGCGGTEEYSRSTGEAVLVQQSTIGTLWTLCWYNRALQEHWGGCAGTAEYYRITLETVLVQQDSIGTPEMPWEVVPVQLSTIGALGTLCWYRRVL